MSKEQVGSLFAELGIEDVSEQQLRNFERNIDQAARRIDRMDDPKLGVDTGSIGPGLDRAERHLRDAHSRFTEQGQIPIELDASHIDDDADEGHRRIGSLVRDWGTTAVVAAGAAGVLAGREFAQQFMDWAERDADTDRLAAKLGLGEWAAARYGQLAGEIYKRNFGESASDVTAAIYEGQSAGVFNFGSSDTEISTLTERALTLVDLFDQDLPTVMAAVSTMLKTGLAHDAWEAFDILTKGFQNGANKGDELLASLTEYPTLMRELGASGQEALGMILQGVGAGARGPDLVVDALKEFTIRAKDGSTASSEAYKLLGLDAGKMAADVAAGGDRAKGALDKVLDRLRDMKDPVKQNAAAVGLFGTQAEDLQDALFALDPSEATKGLDDLAGAAERAQDVAGDNLAGSLESLQRRTKMAVEDYVGSLWSAYEEDGFDGLMEKLSGDLDKLGAWWDENGGVITAAADQWWDKYGEPFMADLGGKLMGALWDGYWQAWKDQAQDRADWAAGWGLDLGVGILDGIEASLAAADSVWDGLTDSFKAIPNAFVDALNQMIDAWNDLEFTLPEKEIFGVKVGGQTLGTPNLDHLPHFATGGVAPGPVGSPLLAVIHGGETIRNPSQEAARDQLLAAVLAHGTGGGRTVNMTNNFLTPKDDQAMVRDMRWAFRAA